MAYLVSNSGLVLPLYSSRTDNLKPFEEKAELNRGYGSTSVIVTTFDGLPKPRKLELSCNASSLVSHERSRQAFSDVQDAAPNADYLYGSGVFEGMSLPIKSAIINEPLVPYSNNHTYTLEVTPSNVLGWQEWEATKGSASTASEASQSVAGRRIYGLVANTYLKALVHFEEASAMSVYFATRLDIGGDHGIFALGRELTNMGFPGDMLGLLYEDSQWRARIGPLTHTVAPSQAPVPGEFAFWHLGFDVSSREIALDVLSPSVVAPDGDHKTFRRLYYTRAADIAQPFEFANSTITLGTDTGDSMTGVFVPGWRKEGIPFFTFQLDKKHDIERKLYEFRRLVLGTPINIVPPPPSVRIEIENVPDDGVIRLKPGETKNLPIKVTKLGAFTDALNFATSTTLSDVTHRVIYLDNVPHLSLIATADVETAVGTATVQATSANNSAITDTDSVNLTTTSQSDLPEIIDPDQIFPVDYRVDDLLADTQGGAGLTLIGTARANAEHDGLHCDGVRTGSNSDLVQQPLIFAPESTTEMLDGFAVTALFGDLPKLDNGARFFWMAHSTNGNERCWAERVAGGVQVYTQDINIGNPVAGNAVVSVTNLTALSLIYDKQKVYLLNADTGETTSVTPNWSKSGKVRASWGGLYKTQVSGGSTTTKYQYNCPVNLYAAAKHTSFLTTDGALSSIEKYKKSADKLREYTLRTDATEIRYELQGNVAGDYSITPNYPTENARLDNTGLILTGAAARVGSDVITDGSTGTLVRTPFIGEASIDFEVFFNLKNLLSGGTDNVFAVSIENDHNHWILGNVQSDGQLRVKVKDGPDPDQKLYLALDDLTDDLRTIIIRSSGGLITVHDASTSKAATHGTPTNWAGGISAQIGGLYQGEDGGSYRGLAPGTEGAATCERIVIVNEPLNTSQRANNVYAMRGTWNSTMEPVDYDGPDEPIYANTTIVQNSQELHDALEANASDVALDDVNIFDGPLVYRDDYQLGDQVSGGQNFGNASFNRAIRHTCAIRNFPGKRPIVDGSAYLWQDFGGPSSTSKPNGSPYKVELWSVRGQNSVIKGIEFRNSADRTLRVFGDNTKIQYCYILNSASDPIGLNADDIQVRYCCGNGARDIRDDGDTADGLIKTVGAPNYRADIQYCVAINFDDDGIDMYTGIDGRVVDVIVMNGGRAGSNFGQAVKMGSNPSSEFSYRTTLTADSGMLFKGIICLNNGAHGLNNNGSGGATVTECISMDSNQYTSFLTRDFNSYQNNNPPPEVPLQPNNFNNNIATTNGGTFNLQSRDISSGNSWQKSYSPDETQLRILLAEIEADPSNWRLYAEDAAVWTERDRLLAQLRAA